ncbi:hypothetical protein [Microvirga splendida]|uniref:Helicase ATP-binding domain-containing protein n=1 Tax=Microvirga splendida TaxID=2795727 RepID=A0ABS0Y3M0_9HYPH|nr:hypothetical protein [Microvirga splendida]MBJ6126906.1 hypothetical protein [Microvirga splendida]
MKFHPDGAPRDTKLNGFENAFQRARARQQNKGTRDPLADDKALIIQKIVSLQKEFQSALQEELKANRDRIASRLAEIGHRSRKSVVFDPSEPVVFLDTERAIANVRNSSNAHHINTLASKLRDGGVGIHTNQVRTIVACLIEMALNPNKSGVILGPMQSGKTGTALGVATFIAPILYLLSGIRFYPLFLTTNQISHREQTEEEYRNVRELYGDIEILVGESSLTPHKYYTSPDFFSFAYATAKQSGFAHDEPIDPRFDAYPSPKNYRDVVMGKAALGDSFVLPPVIFGRNPGRSVRDLRETMKRASDHGFSLLLLMDEPQYGAIGDEPVEGQNSKGQPTLYGCVTKQILHGIRREVMRSDSGKHILIGFSATPFEMLARDFFLVRSRLSKNYVGLNMWNGSAIDPTVGQDQRPTVHRLSSLVHLDPNIRDFAKFLGATTRSQRFIMGSGLPLEKVQKLAGKMFCRIVEHLLKDRPGAGVCVRFANNNLVTTQLIRNMGLDEHFEVCRFDSIGGSGKSIRREIALARPIGRNRLLVTVTNKARMGDNFPREIELFLDFTGGKTVTLNALLQGLFGRACGEAKFFSQVVLSDDAVDTLEAYISSMGKIVTTPSRGAIQIQESDMLDARGRGTRLMRVGIYGEGSSDTKIRAFLDDVTKRIVAPRFGNKSGKLGRSSERSEVDLLPLLRKHKILEYVSKNQERLFPQYRPMEIAFPHESLEMRNKIYSWPINPVNDLVEVTFRHVTHALAANRTPKVTFAHLEKARLEGRADRGKGNKLHIQINLMKVDEQGKEIPDSLTPGYWKAYSVTFPLKHEVSRRTVRNNSGLALPREETFTNDALHDDEIDIRNNALKREGY